MTVIASSKWKGRGGPSGRALHGFIASLHDRVARIVRVYHHRSDAAVLARLDERDLADIGLTPSDVRDAFAGPLWQDPTNLLRSRALERRLSRHGISFGLQDASAAPPLVPDFARLPTNRPARFTV